MLRYLLILVLMLPLAARAEPLTERDVLNFLSAAEELKALEGRYPDADLDFTDSDNPMEVMDRMFAEDGSLQVMDLFLEKVRETPDAYADLTRAVKSSGFASPQAFADVGDRVIMAKARAEIPDEQLAEMRMAANMSKDQLAMVPPQMRAMVEKATRFASFLETVPASDVALVQRFDAQFRALED